MFQVGRHIDDQNTGTRLVIEAVEKDHVLCRVQRRRPERKKVRSPQNPRQSVTSSKA
jgi:hypothetical protein